jgi:hypothetical protein
VFLLENTLKEFAIAAGVWATYPARETTTKLVLEVRGQDRAQLRNYFRCKQALNGHACILPKVMNLRPAGSFPSAGHKQ